MHHRLRPPSRRARAIGLALALAAGGAVAPARPAVAERPSTPIERVTIGALASPSPALPGLPSTSIELAAVPVDSADFQRAAADYRAIDADHAAARTQRAELDRAATAVAARIRALTAARAAARARAGGLSTRLQVVERAIQDLAVQSYVAGGVDERLNAVMASEQPSINDVDRRDVLAGVTMNVLLAERGGYRARIDDAAARAAEAEHDLAGARRALDRLRSDRPAALRAEVRTGAKVATARVAYEGARVLATVDGVEFPLVALDAYYRAAGAVEAERPACGLQWWGVAGIAKVEGSHGTYGGTTLEPNGDASARIIGIPLDGTNATQLVGDSDAGAFDGDPTYDRAVGPMQFIPQTWKRFKADGNEDGDASPFNLYDATLAAATYLCTVSGGLKDDAGLRAAYFGYNHSVAYVDQVLGYAHLYRQAVDVPSAG